MSNKQVYLDHNATTPLHPQVRLALNQAMEVFGNPSSLHTYGRKARLMIESAREDIASFIGANSEEIIFTGSGSEANNTVLSIFSCPSCRCSSHKQMCSNKKVITTAIEHPCVLEASRCLEDRGIKVVYQKVDQFGKISLDEFKDNLTADVGIASVMMANNEIGTIQDIKTLASLAHRNGSLFHSDAVQAVGKIPVNVRDLDVDFLTFSAHKIYGPKGIGAIYIKKGIPFCPFIRGGHQERGRRAGTENTLGIAGFAAAVKMRREEMESEGKRLLELKTWLKNEITKNIADIRFNGHPTESLAGTLNVSFDATEGEAVLLYLDMEGIAVSTGSACASGSLDPSHVLLAIGAGAEFAHSSIRVSFGRDSTIEEAKYFLEKITLVVEKVRSISSAYYARKSNVDSHKDTRSQSHK